LSEKHSGCTAHFKPGILLSFLANIFSPMQPKLVATSSCQILVFGSNSCLLLVSTNS
jgi:hypothetical protein